MKASVLLSILTSASASLCCIVPVLGFIGGSGSLVSSVSWLEPFRPFFIASTFLTLGLSWYVSIKTTKKDHCGCETEKLSFFQSKKFLGIVTVLSFILLSFPSYSKYVITNNKKASMTNDQEKNAKLTLAVTGVTCASCEKHVESEIIKLSGISSVKASYEKKSATIEYNPQKVNVDKIVAAINSTGYTADKSINLIQDKPKAEYCTKGSSTPVSCTMPTVAIPKEKNKNLKVLSSVDELKASFNKGKEKVRFIAILSSTCGWCLQGAQSVQQAVIEKMSDKEINVIIVWTNMLETDDKENAYRAASMFKDPSIVQYFDSENKFGDLVAKRLNPKGEKAWDIYMFYDKEIIWNDTIPLPFEYAHQLSTSLSPCADNTKYFCGNDLTKRLRDITTSL